MIFILHYLKIALIIYAVMVAFLFFYQRNLVYFPDKSRPRAPDIGEIVKVRTSDGLDLDGLYFPPKKKDGTVLIYFHGNGGNYSHRFFKIRGYLRLGYGVLLAEYRGYGGNPGSPSEEGFYADGRAYMDWFLKMKAPMKMVLYGESIGSGTATQMATEYPAQALILETPFSSLVDVAAQKYFFVPVRLLLKDRFANDEKIAKIKMPLMIMHGRKDGTIPYEFAQKLYNKAVEPKKFIEFPEGHHNNLYDFAAADFVIGFLNKIESNGGSN